MVSDELPIRRNAALFLVLAAAVEKVRVKVRAGAAAVATKMSAEPGLEALADLGTSRPTGGLERFGGCETVTLVVQQFVEIAFLLLLELAVHVENVPSQDLLAPFFRWPRFLLQFQ